MRLNIYDWITSGQWLITLIIVGATFYRFVYKPAKQAKNSKISEPFDSPSPFMNIPRHGNGYYTSPLNVLYYYYWPYSQIYHMPYRFGGMTKFNRYPYRSAKYYPGWYYEAVGYPYDRRVEL